MYFFLILSRAYDIFDFDKTKDSQKGKIWSEKNLEEEDEDDEDILTPVRRTEPAQHSLTPKTSEWPKRTMSWVAPNSPRVNNSMFFPYLDFLISTYFLFNYNLLVFINFCR